MRDQEKTKEELITELNKLRSRVDELEELAVKHKKLERELKETEEQHRGIFENAVEGIFQTSSDGHIVAVNPAMAKMLGYSSPDELIESVKDARELYIRPGRRLELFHILKEEGIVTDFEAQIRRKDGGKIWVMLNAHAVRDPDGKIAGMGAMVIDMTDRKRAERNFERLLESAPDAMIAITADKNIILSNNQTEKFFGYTKEELIDKTFDILVPDKVKDDHDTYCEGYFNEPSTRAMSPHLVAHAKHKNGSEFPVEINLSPVETEDGVIILADIRTTER